MSRKITQICPFCDSKVEMEWIAKDKVYKADCPNCGERLIQRFDLPLRRINIWGMEK